MATTPSAPVSAPVAATVAAPVAAPAPSAAVATPTPVAPPPAAVEAPVGAPASPAAGTPAAGTPAPAAPPAAEPKSSDYGGDPDGQAKFLQDHMAWEQENGDAAPADAPTDQPAETVDAAAETPLAETVASEEAPSEPTELAEPESITPEAVNAWLQKDPALKAAVEANPAVKRQMFAMARTNAKAQELLTIFPNGAAGKFANEQANRLVDITQAFTNAADHPEAIGDAMDMLATHFAVVDKDGKAVLDGAGNPTYGKDFEMLATSFVDGYLDSEIEDLQAAVAANGDDEDSNLLLSAMQYVKEAKAKRAGGQSQPDKANLTPQQKAWQEQQEAQFEAERQRLGMASTKLTADQKAQQRQSWEVGCQKKIGSSIGRFMDNFMKEQNDNNVFLPSYITDVRDPKDGQSMFVKNIFNEFNQQVMGVAHLRQQLMAFQNGPATPEAEAARVEFYTSLAADYMPGIMEKHLRQVQRQEIADRKKRQGREEAKRNNANVEPITGISGAASGSAGLTEEAAIEKAYAKIDKDFPGLPRDKRTEKALMEFNRMVYAGR